MTIDQAVTIIARHAAAKAVAWEAEYGWISEAWGDYPDIGENDWNEVIARARRYAEEQIAPTPAEYTEAYALLGSLAGDDES